LRGKHHSDVIIKNQKLKKNVIVVVFLL